MPQSKSVVNAAENAAIAVATSYGLPVRESMLIGGYSNILIKLEPLPLVARVAAATATVRTNTEWMSRELAVASYLIEAGVRCVRPSRILPPGPHHHDGLSLTFWEYFLSESAVPTPLQTGELLRELHGVLVGCPVMLPLLGPLQEAWQILDRPDLTHSLKGELRAVVFRKVDLVQHRLGLQMFDYRPLHGDAHHGNLWQTRDGPIWGDLEDSCSGPIEWDIACMVASSRVFGTGSAAAEVLKGYGNGFDPELLEMLVLARTLQAVAWALVSHPEPTASQRLQQRLSWLARQP